MHHPTFASVLLALVIQTSTTRAAPADNSTIIPPNNIIGCYSSPPYNQINKEACDYLLDVAIGQYMNLDTPGNWTADQTYSWNLAGSGGKYAPNACVLEFAPGPAPVNVAVAPSEFVAVAKSILNIPICMKAGAGGGDFLRSFNTARMVKIYAAQTDDKDVGRPDTGNSRQTTGDPGYSVGAGMSVGTVPKGSADAVPVVPVAQGD